jgi:hypothetical protein
MKSSSDTIGNGTRDLPACSAVPQPTAPPLPPPPKCQYVTDNKLHMFVPFDVIVCLTTACNKQLFALHKCPHWHGQT